MRPFRTSPVNRFVEMTDEAASKKAIAELDGATVKNTTIKVNEARPKAVHLPERPATHYFNPSTWRSQPKPLITDEDRQLFGRQGKGGDQFGYIDTETRAVFGRSYAVEPDQLIRELALDEDIQEADTLLLTIPNTPGVEYNVHILSSFLQHVAPGLAWR